MNSIAKLDNFIYQVLDKKIDKMPSKVIKVVALYYPDARIRKKYLQKMGVLMGNGTYANLGLKVVPSEKEISVKIGDNVSIAPNVTFIANSAPNNGKEILKIDYIREKLIKDETIIIDNEVWIGANVTILPGIKVGKCSVIGAGSVVVDDVEPYSIYAGVPAKKIRELRQT